MAITGLDILGYPVAYDGTVTVVYDSTTRDAPRDLKVRFRLPWRATPDQIEAVIRIAEREHHAGFHLGKEAGRDELTTDIKALASRHWESDLEDLEKDEARFPFLRAEEDGVLPDEDEDEAVSDP